MVFDFPFLISVTDVDSHDGLIILESIQSKFDVYSVEIKKRRIRGGSGT